MSVFFQFESDFVDDLRCIPMQVRYKLDTCGIKLKLQQWHRFSEHDRQGLIDRPCANPEETQTYRTHLQTLIREQTGEMAKELQIEAHPAWAETSTVPDSITSKAKEFNVNLTLEHWAKLSDLQRFALVKLSRSSHENSNFLPALKEFHIIE